MRNSIWILAFSTLISSAGISLLVSALAIKVFYSSASALHASAVYIAQLVPGIVFLPVVLHLCNMYSKKMGLVMAELLAAILTLALGMLIEDAVLFNVCLLLAVRGVFELMTKTLRSSAVKAYSSCCSIALSNNLVMGFNFLGQMVGGLVGFLLISHVQLFEIAIINAVAHILSAIILLLLSSERASDRISSLYESQAIKYGFQVLQRKFSLRFDFIYLVLVVVIFQAYNQVARTWIVLEWLGLGLNFGFLGEIVGSLGIAGGLLLATIMAKKAYNKIIRAPIVVALAAVLIGFPFFAKSSVLVLIYYFAYMVAFEFSLMVCLNGVLRACPKEAVASVMGIFYGFSFALMAVMTMLIAVMADMYGLPVVAFLITLFVLIAALVGCRYPRLDFKRRRKYIV